MSMSESFYVGPYIKAFYHYIDEDVEYRGCPKCKERERDGKYCKSCGGKLDNFSVKEKRKSINWSYLSLEKFDDIFLSTGEVKHEGFDILRTNGEFYGDREFDLEDIELQKIESKDIDEEIEWFIKKYKSEIKKLEKYYDKVIVEWGIVQSYS